MWDARTDSTERNVHKIRLFENTDQLSYESVIGYWHSRPEFRDFYISTLKDARFEAFFWENPPLTRSNISQPYEFVLLASPQLSRVSADPQPFSQQFRQLDNDQSVIQFQNLGGDAVLIAPRPIASQIDYAHFAVFLRHTPASQAHQLFMVLADALKKTVSNDPVWVSTSGLGVYWLHIRLDKRPKYYTYQPYRQYFEE